MKIGCVDVTPQGLEARRKGWQRSAAQRRRTDFPLRKALAEQAGITEGAAYMRWSKVKSLDRAILKHNLRLKSQVPK